MHSQSYGASQIHESMRQLNTVANHAQESMRAVDLIAEKIRQASSDLHQEVSRFVVFKSEYKR